MSTVVFDVDGCLLDSIDGIVAGYQHALTSVGVEPPSEAVLRSDVGPPVGVLFTSLGLADSLREQAVAAYRAFYAETGMHQARVFPGVVDLLDGLAAIDAPVAQLSFTTSTKPAVITGRAADDGESMADYRYLLMPVRLSS